MWLRPKNETQQGPPKSCQEFEWKGCARENVSELDIDARDPPHGKGNQFKIRRHFTFALTVNSDRYMPAIVSWSPQIAAANSAIRPSHPHGRRVSNVPQCVPTSPTNDELPLSGLSVKHLRRI